MKEDTVEWLVALLNLRVFLVLREAEVALV
jgi:hypothetical protein